MHTIDQTHKHLNIPHTHGCLICKNKEESIDKRARRWICDLFEIILFAIVYDDVTEI